MSADKQTMQALRVLAKAANADALAPQCIAQDPPAIKAGEALVRVRSAGVNPSDVKAALGLMPQAVFPRTPGRDYAGVVVEGPSNWVGKEIWGSGGDVGITRDAPCVRGALAPDGHDQAAAMHQRRAGKRFHQHGDVRTRIGPIAKDGYFFDFHRAVDAELAGHVVHAFGERVFAEGLLTRDHENHVFCHKGQNGIDVTGCRCLHPEVNGAADCLFVLGHGEKSFGFVARIR